VARRQSRWTGSAASRAYRWRRERRRGRGEEWVGWVGQTRRRRSGGRVVHQIPAAGLHGPWRAPADRTAGAAGKRFAGGSRGGYMRAVWWALVRKHSLFGRNAPQIAISIVVPPFCSSRNLTGGSGVRGKAGLNWVRKVFNCLHSF
jgi:hypothetical protein